jgi:hypothetical protein
MMTKPNAFTIDPATRHIEAVTTDLDDYTDIYRKIGVNTFDAIGLRLIASKSPIVCTLWIDDEGAIDRTTGGQKRDQKCFLIGHRPEEARLFAGKALLTGPAGPEGETLAIDERLSIFDLMNQVQWTDMQVTPGFIITDMATGKIL